MEDMEVRMVVVKSKAKYCRDLWHSLFICCAYFAVGMVFWPVLDSFLRDAHAHVILAFVSLHIFMFQALMSYNQAGWANHMRPKHRFATHVTFNCLSFVFIGLSYFWLFKDGYMKIKEEAMSMHCVTGILSTMFSIMGALFGLLAYCFHRKWSEVVHVMFGILTIIFASMCVGTGFQKSALHVNDVFFVIVVCIVFYTLVVLIDPFAKILYRM